MDLAPTNPACRPVSNTGWHQHLFCGVCTGVRRRARKRAHTDRAWAPASPTPKQQDVADSLQTKTMESGTLPASSTSHALSLP